MSESNNRLNNDGSNSFDGWTPQPAKAARRRNPENEKTTYRVSEREPPEGVRLVCYDADYGCVMIDGRLYAYRWDVKSHSVSFAPEGYFELLPDTHAFVVLYKARRPAGSGFECQSGYCRTDGGLRSARDCVHCRAAKWIVWATGLNHDT